ncbi:MAG: tRNA pseudouridine(55) synthase TruB, partial [Pontixanthobacter sp.]
LDPLAQGVLPIALGEATKLAGRMLDASKIYEFTVQFGEETSTVDSEGEVVLTSDRRPPMLAIEGVLDHFEGELDQVPPAFSAIKIDGKRAYDRARAGEDVELKTRRVTIYSLTTHRHPREGGDPETPGTELDVADSHARGNDDTIHSTFQTTLGRPDPYDPGAPLELADAVTLTAHVSKGTYIRSLARDIAHALGTVGHVTYLRRLKAGPFDETRAISLDRLNEIGKGAPLKDVMLPLEAGLDDIPALTLTSEQAASVRQGRVLTGQPHTDGLYCAMYRDIPVALVELTDGAMKIVRGFNLHDVAE